MVGYQEQTFGGGDCDFSLNSVWDSLRFRVYIFMSSTEFGRFLIIICSCSFLAPVSFSNKNSPSGISVMSVRPFDLVQLVTKAAHLLSTRPLLFKVLRFPLTILRFVDCLLCHLHSVSSPPGILFKILYFLIQNFYLVLFIVAISLPRMSPLLIYLYLVEQDDSRALSVIPQVLVALGLTSVTCFFL